MEKHRKNDLILKMLIDLCVQSFTAEDGLPSSPQRHFCFGEQSSRCGKNETFTACRHECLHLGNVVKYLWSATSSGPRLLPHAVPLRRWRGADLCVEAGHPQAEYPEEHLRHGALQEHGQESHHRGPQHRPGHAAPEQHHVSHSEGQAGGI